MVQYYNSKTYIAASEIATLKHKVWDHTMEARTFITFNFPIGELESIAKVLEILDSFGNVVFVEIEVDTLWL